MPVRRRKAVKERGTGAMDTEAVETKSSGVF